MEKEVVITSDELRRLIKVIDEKESHAFLPLKHQSGAFVSTEIFNIDPEIIDIQLILGVQDGENDWIQRRIYHIDRESMRIL